MPAPTYLYVQSDRFYYRRRIPTLSTCKSPLMVSLRTKNKNQALIWSLSLTKEFETVLNSFAFIHDPIPDALVHKFMQRRLKQFVDDLKRQSRMAWFTGRKHSFSECDRSALQHALKALIKFGPHHPFPVEAIDPEWSPTELSRAMEIFDQEARKLKSPGMMDHLVREFKEATDYVPRSAEHDAQIMQAYLESMLTAAQPEQEARQPLLELREECNAPDASKQRSTVVANEPAPLLTPGVNLIASKLTTRLLNDQFEAARASKEDLDRSTEKDPFGVDFAGVCERSIKHAQINGTMDNKTADARRSKIKLFCLLTGVQLVTEVEQYHLRIFERSLAEVHKNFMRSPAHLDFTWDDIQELANASADDDLGRAPKTFNTYLEQVSAILSYAQGIEDTSINSKIDTSKLRKPETKRGRSKRAAFKENELKDLFKHPVWQGCSNESRRHDKGNLVHKDGLYYVPMIVAYTGGRMEEIAGLTVDSIIEVDGSYGLDIRPHAERRLKNLQSERLVHIHEHLIAQGLIEHRNHMRSKGETLLFPELRPKSEKKKFISALRYNWGKLRSQQLDGNPKGLDGHSLRHSFNQFLKNQKDVKKEVRLDILGHAGEDLNEEIYGDEEGMPFEMKKAAIDLQPRLF